MLSKKRIKGLKFHVKVNDYFATLATVLHLYGQELIKDREKLDKKIKLLENIKNDLMFLQENKKITNK